MAASLRLLRAKCWAQRIHLAQGHRSRFHIELARLCKECLFVEVVDREQRTGAFTRGWSNDGRIGQGESAFVEEVAGGFDDLGAYAENRGLALRAHPEMAVLHEEVRAVLFGRDGVRR